MKKICSILLVINFIFSPIFSFAADDFTIENGILVKYTGSGGDVIIPEDVTSIGKSAFAGSQTITGITLCESLINIGEGAFVNCRNLTSVKIPNNVVWIDKHAFSGCSGLTDLTLGYNVRRIGSKAFFGCKGLTSLVIPTSVENIFEGAFEGCTGIKSVTMPHGVILEDYVFKGLSDVNFYTNSGNNPNDFTIENGILTKYSGKD